MALPVVLSAMKEILLSLGDLPADPLERRALLKRTFPNLSDVELDNLAHIPPKEEKTFTRSPFSGETKLLEDIFPITVASLRDHWKSAYGEEFNAATFITLMHETYPWESYTTEGIVGNFLSFLSINLPDLHSKVGWISELATLEHTAFLIRTLPEEDLGNVTLVPLGDIPSLRVSELLDLQFTIKPPARLLRCHWRILYIWEMYRKQAGVFESSLIHSPTCVAGGRDRNGEAQWTEIPEGVYELLARTPPGRWVSVTNLAEAVIASLPGISSEEESFDIFLEIFISLLRSGAIVTVKTE